MVWRRERKFFRFFFPSCIFLSPFSFPPRKIQGTKKMKEEGVKKKGGKKEKKRKEILLVFRERILRCDVCVCACVFLLWRVSHRSSLFVDCLSTRKGNRRKRRGRDARSILIFARGPTCCRGVFLRRAEGRIELGREIKKSNRIVRRRRTRCRQ